MSLRFKDFNFRYLFYFRLALYVYEYLLHVGAQKAAQTFLSEVSANIFYLNCKYQFYQTCLLIWLVSCEKVLSDRTNLFKSKQFSVSMIFIYLFKLKIWTSSYCLIQYLANDCLLHCQFKIFVQNIYLVCLYFAVTFLF